MAGSLPCALAALTGTESVGEPPAVRSWDDGGPDQNCVSLPLTNREQDRRELCCIWLRQATYSLTRASVTFISCSSTERIFLSVLVVAAARHPPPRLHSLAYSILQFNPSVPLLARKHISCLCSFSCSLHEHAAVAAEPDPGVIHAHGHS